MLCLNSIVMFLLIIKQHQGIKIQIWDHSKTTLIYQRECKYFLDVYKQTRFNLCLFKISGFSDKDLDDLRGIFTDTNLFLLGVTFAITVLHVCFTNYYTLNVWSRGKHYFSFVFPRVLMFPKTKSRETSGLEGKQN